MRSLIVKEKLYVNKIWKVHNKIGMQLMHVVIIYCMWKTFFSSFEEPRFQIIFSIISIFLVIVVISARTSYLLHHTEPAVALLS